jgi:6-pyruvoyltetrahydropterin/6-carboxytetrahydropterin synthase
MNYFKDIKLDLDYSIKVYKQYFNFAAGHFLVFKDGTREPLHGHNYRVMIKGNSNKLESDMVFDFLDIKPIVREVCDSLDHKVLLPSENPQLLLSEEDNNYKIETPDKSYFSLPKSDVKILPIPNTSAERLAVYLAYEIKSLVKQRFNFVFSSLEVEVEETPGQSAVFVMDS